MSRVETVAAGDWNDTAIWDTGVLPTNADLVILNHPVTVKHDFTALGIRIAEGGSITVDPENYAYASQITAHVPEWSLDCVLDDDRTVRLDGVLFEGVHPSIGCTGHIAGLPYMGKIQQNTARDIIIADPGYIGTSAKLQDINPEGSGRAYARKVSNSVRYLTVTVRIRASMPRYLGILYRLAEGPFQVLLVTDRAIIKGHIETVAPDQGAVGTEYISVRVTVAEGL